MGERTLQAIPATARGRLMALRWAGEWFPAMLPAAPGSRCHGTLLKATLTPAELALLDRYEGCEYRRVKISVRGGETGSRLAQAYLWCAPLPAAALPIRDGDFLAWITRTGRERFGGAGGPG